jgi:hypothetical protein
VQAGVRDVWNGQVVVVVSSGPFGSLKFSSKPTCLLAVAHSLSTLAAANGNAYMCIVFAMAKLAEWLMPDADLLAVCCTVVCCTVVCCTVVCWATAHGGQAGPVRH